MEIIIKIDTNVPVTDKDKFFISFLNNVYNGKKSFDEIVDETKMVMTIVKPGLPQRQKR